MPVDLDAPNRAALRMFGASVQTGKRWTITPHGSPAFDIDGIYDEAWATVDIKPVGRRGGIAPVSTTAPAFWLRLADAPGGYQPTQKDALKNNVTGQTYEVADSLLDGMGGIRLILTETT